MASRERKSKKVTTTTPNPSLPYDLLVTCLARVSKLYYRTLSLASKSFRSLLASPELYKTRSVLRCTESCLYVCLRFPETQTYPRWFTLYRKPDPTLSKSSGYLLVQITSPQPPTLHWSSQVAVGSNIYHFGGYSDTGTLASSSVSVLDCGSHTWREAQTLQVKMIQPSASFFDGKIYVAGGFSEDLPESSKTMEVLDTKTQIWDHVPIPYWDGYKYLGRLTKSTGMEGKVYLMLQSRVLAYDLEDGRWDFVEPEMGQGWDWFSNCAIENVLYCFYEGELKWYDNKVGLWKLIKGLRGVLPTFTSSSVVKLADYGGKMAVLWNKYERPDSEYNIIWCAVIELEGRNNNEIWGKVEWYDAVLIVPRSTQLEYALTATV